MAKVELSRVGEIVRRHDPDRFFTALFAPAEHRETLFTLYAFNHELARASEVAREPIAALIRLQWWREVLEGARRRHEVAGPLGEALDSGRLLMADLAPMVDAREMETEPIPDLEAFSHYVQGTAGRLMVAAGRVLGLREAETLLLPGASYGISGLLRNAAARHDRAATIPGADWLDGSTVKRLGLEWLPRRAVVSRSAVAAVLPVVFARERLHGRTGLLANRVMVTMAALTGRP